MGATNLEADDYKNKGNDEFKKENYSGAIALYSKAVELAEVESRELCVYLKNRAAAYLKLKQFKGAIEDCDAALKIVPEDPKALFRRSQALEAEGRYEEAYRDAKAAHNAEPNNKTLQPVLARLYQVVQERARVNSQTSSKVEQMAGIAFDVAADGEKREAAINNLLVLSKENAGAEVIYRSGIVNKIVALLKVERSEKMCVSAVRIVGQLCKKSAERARGVLQVCGIPWFLQVLDSPEEQRVNAAQYCLQTVLNTFSGMDNKAGSKPDQALCEKHKSEIDTLLTCLTCSITNRTISGLARDAIMELIMKNCHYTAIDWAERFVEMKGLLRLLEVCSELEEYKYESAMNISPSARTIAAVCLSKIYENMYYDQARERFTDQVNEFVKEKLLSPDIESKVRVTVAITSLLLGPLDVGNSIISREGIMEMILVMANTEDKLQQKVACECLIAAASKKDKAKAIISQGVHILKNLYKSNDDSIKVRALVGLCKLGSSGGVDASIRPFADGATSKLAEACRRFLVNPAKDRDMRRWAAEGLSYLTLDADVKEKLVEDKAAVQALIELAKTGNQSVIYGVVTTLVNLCNAYEKQEMLPEMVELARFAKHHIPEEHELDDPDFVSKRLTILVKEGVTTALVALSKTESHNSRELIARVFNAVCSQQELRGAVVQQGGVKVLLALSLEGTPKGKVQAAQALARIGITIDPQVSFSGQRSLEVVRPLTCLLHPDCSALENFEGLMALCNIAAVSESTRKRIMQECGLARIEALLFEDHVLLKRAATQVITNLVMSEDVVKAHEGNNDRVKFLALLCLEEDQETVLAAAGALAILTSSSKECCQKVLEVNNWLEVLHCVLANVNPGVQHRGLVVVHNMLACDRALAAEIISTDVMEILMALTTTADAAEASPTTAVIRDTAHRCLGLAEEMKLISKPGDAPTAHIPPLSAAPQLPAEEADDLE